MLAIMPIAAAVLLASAAPGEPQPAIAVMPTTRDFGVVLEPELVWTWTFRNVGKAPLEVTAPGCDCAKAGFTLPTEPTPPAAAGEVRFAVTLNHRQPGPGERRITVTTNDPQYPRINLAVRWTYTPIAKLSPPDIRIGPVAPGAGGDAYITLLSRDPDIDIIDIASASKLVTIALADDDDPSTDPIYPGRIVLKATLSPEAPTGQTIDTLTLTTRVTRRAGEEPSTEVLTAQIDAQVQSDLELDRRFIRFADTLPGRPVAGDCTITARSQAPFRIVSARLVDPPFDGIELTIKQAQSSPDRDGASTAFTIALEGAAPSSPGLYQGAIELLTDRPLESPIRIPFNLMVKREPALDGNPNRPVPEQPATLRQRTPAAP